MTTIDSDFTPKRSKIVIRLVKFQCHADHLHLWQVETIVLRVRETAYIISLISRLNDKSHCFHDRLTALLKLHYRLISNIDKLHKQPERIYGTCTFHRFESRFEKFGIVETKGRERENAPFRGLDPLSIAYVSQVLQNSGNESIAALRRLFKSIYVTSRSCVDVLLMRVAFHRNGATRTHDLRSLFSSPVAPVIHLRRSILHPIFIRNKGNSSFRLSSIIENIFDALQ